MKKFLRQAYVFASALWVALSLILLIWMFWNDSSAAISSLLKTGGIIILTLIAVTALVSGGWVGVCKATELYKEWQKPSETDALPRDPCGLCRSVALVLGMFAFGFGLWWWEAGRHLECTGGPSGPPIEPSGYQQSWYY